MDVLREVLSRVLRDNCLVQHNQRLQLISRERRVGRRPTFMLGLFQGSFEQAVVNSQNDVGIHLNETAIAVPRKPRVATASGQPIHRQIVEAKIKDGIHHARH